MNANTKKNIMNFLHTINLGVLAGGVIGALPADLQGNKWVMTIQVLLATLLPSYGGVGHKLMTGKPQIEMKNEG